jgi:hypothetical protein
MIQCRFHIESAAPPRWLVHNEVGEATLTEILTLMEKLYAADSSHPCLVSYAAQPIGAFGDSATAHTANVHAVSSHLAIDTNPPSACMPGFLELLVSIMRICTQPKFKICLAYLQPNY